MVLSCPVLIQSTSYMLLFLQLEQTELIYLTDERNTAILPEEDGTFDAYGLTSGDHYKVVGTVVGSARIAAAVPAPSHTPMHVAYQNPPSSATRKSNYCTLDAVVLA